MSKHFKHKKHRRHDHPDKLDDKDQAVLLALKQGMGVLRKGFEIYGIKLDGSVEVLARGSKGHELWHEAYAELKRRASLPPSIEAGQSHVISLKVYTDGGSRGNPGPSASGYVIMGEDDRILEEGGRYLGRTTNNQAEYTAVKLGLEAVAKFQPQKLDFYLDSQLVVNQLNGTYKLKNAELRPLYEQIKELLHQYPNTTFHHVYREFNQLADKQVNIILDEQDQISPKTS